MNHLYSNQMNYHLWNLPFKVSIKKQERYKTKMIFKEAYVRNPSGEKVGYVCAAVEPEIDPDRAVFGFSQCSIMDSFDREMGKFIANGRIGSGRYTANVHSLVSDISRCMNGHPMIAPNIIQRLTEVCSWSLEAAHKRSKSLK